MIEIINWDVIKKRIKNTEWAGKFIEDTKIRLDGFIESYFDESTRVTGWFHHYNCEKCQGRLTFNIENSEEHVCSVCGHVNKGETITKVWYNMYRGRANTSVYESGIMYRLTGEEKYIKHMKRVLSFYADNYDDFVSEPIAKRFEGKLQNQHLDDASAVIAMIQGIDMARERFSDKELKYYYEELFKKEAEMFDFFANRIYNIPVWIKCAQAMVGVFFGEEEHIKKGFYSVYGILDQLKKGVTDEGMWYEGSMHYHYYTVHPIAMLMFICRRVEFDIPEMQYIYDKVEKMFEYPLKMMFSNKRLPNPHDGHPYIDIFNYRTHYEYASIIYENPLFKKVCSMFWAGEVKPSFARLLFNIWENETYDVDFGTLNNPASGTAMLREGGTELFFRYSTLTHLHRHPDEMSFELVFDGDAVSYDIGNGGYASSLFVEWQRKTLCHNTVVIDESDHMRMSLPFGEAEEFNKEDSYIKVKTKALYEATDFTRAFKVDNNKVKDDFLVYSWDTHLVDWFFYCEGELICNNETEDVETLAPEYLKNGKPDPHGRIAPRQAGYQHLMDVKRFKTDEDWTVDFELPDKIIRVTMKGEPETIVHLVNSYTANKEKTRRGLMVRRQADKTLFATTYECIYK